jgi:hypothetical protein
MTEQEWLGCTAPWLMLEYLQDKASERKLQLVACACCRRIPGFLESEPDRQGLELTERDADGLATDEEFETLPNDDWDIRWYRRNCWDAIHRAMGSYHDYVWDSVWESRNPYATTEQAQDQARRQSDADLAVLLFDIFGNPFRPVSIDPSWLTWHDGLLVSMARQMYDSSDFRDMPVLGDALEEAGCQDQSILGHCRSGGVHGRGCWVVDLVLGKK